MPKIPLLSTTGTRALAVAGACAALAGGLAAAPAMASHGQITFFEAPRQLENAATRARTMQQLKLLGVDALRLELHWSEAAPAANSSRRPHFNATEPSSYNWGQNPAIVYEAQKLGWPVLLTVTGSVPKWATAARRDMVTRPDDKFFEEFMTAVGKRFGNQVTYWALWNEPNIPGWLSPQFNTNGTPASPRLYRGLFEAGYAGLQAAGVSSPKVLFGETAPFGVDSIRRGESVNQEMSPLTFMREALCLNSHYRKAPTCSPLPIYGYGMHPYTYPALESTGYRPANPDQVTIGTLSRLSNAIDKAAAAHAIPRRVPIFITEFGVETKPNPLGVTYSEQVEYDAVSEQIAWSDPGVVSFSQYLLADEPPHGREKGYRTGLETSSGSRKPLYYAFPVPIVVSRAGSGYSLWGHVRPATGVTKVHVYVRPPGSRSFRTLAIVTTDSSGYWTLHSSTAGSAWRVGWRSPAGVVYNGPSVGALF